MAKEPAKKSSSGKKATARKKATPAKKTAAKKKPATKRVKTASKKKSAPKAKNTASRAPKSGVKKPARKKKVSIKDLLAKKFERMASPTLVRVEAPAPAKGALPPHISVGSMQDTSGLQPLLLKKIDYNDLVTAAKKAAAEKATAEKAAAEKAAGEKAAAEKAAIEKAAAEKAAVEKTATGKDAAKVTLTYGSADAKGNDTMDNTIKILAGAVLAVILLLVIASFSNTGNYYLRQTNGTLQVWQGNFAPKGEHLLISLPDMPAPDVVQSVYTAKNILPLAFNYYIDKADGLLSKKGMPDFGAIQTYLNKSSKFAVTPATKAALNTRTTMLNMLVLLYKAEAFAAKKQPADLKQALGYLDKAETIAATEAQRAMIAEKRTAINKALEKPPAAKTAKPEMVTHPSEKPASPQVQTKPTAKHE